MKFPQLKFMRIPSARVTTKSLAAAIFMMSLVIGIPAQKRMVTVKSAADAVQESVKGSETPEMAVPAPVSFPGNPTCADVNASTNPAFAHVTQDFGLKVNRGGSPAFTQQFFFVNGPDTILQGGAGPSPSSFVWVSMDGNELDWSSNRKLTAVIVKGGTTNQVYPYNPTSQGGNPDGVGLFTGNQNGVSHVIFCFESLAPTAAPARVSGRVVDSYGRGISTARLALTNAQNGEIFIAITNPFGYYTIDGPEVGNFYVMTVSHKRYSFADNTRSFTLNEDLAGLDFIANP